jgi:hypothetical protein
MRRVSMLLVPGVIALVLGWAPPIAGVVHAQAVAESTAASTAVSLTPQEMEAFLKGAKIVRRRDAGNGVTGTERLTLSDGRLTHDAQIQTIDQAKAVFEAGNKTELNFKDSYRFNIAGYRLALLLGMDNVPMSVERRVEAKVGAMTWWLDDVMMDEKARLTKKTAGPDPARTSRQVSVMRVFDELIQNMDRNQGNILWTKDWKMWLIDHTRAFRTGRQLRNPAQLTRCDRALLDHLRALTPDMLERGMAGSLTKIEMDTLLARRDLIVKHFEERIAKLGEDVVLFTL